MRNSILCYVFILIFSASVQPLSAETITVSSISALPEEVVSIPITVDIPENIAGAVFTLTYNSSYFTLTDIQSEFFDTFTDQWQALNPIPDPLPPGQVTVDGTEYSRPLVSNTISSTTLFAAARVKAGATETTLFTLQFTVADSVPNGIYPVSISAVSISNTVAGYSASGEVIPILLGQVEGEQDLSLAYPAIAVALVNGSVTVNKIIIDTDLDGIADEWEIENFGNLNTATGRSDYDEDGYTDRQEYLNSLAGETDSAGAIFDPEIANLPGGTGYNPDPGSSSFWNLMIPALIKHGQGN